MYNIQGFVQINSLINNTPTELSPVGELSSKCASYARDKQIFGKASLQVELICFTSERDEAVITVPAEYTDHILELTQWVYSQAISGVSTSDYIAFQEKLFAKFSDKVTNLISGEMVSANSNWFPKYISWSYDNNEENAIKFWFADASFATDYTGYTILVLPPVDPVDNLLLSTTQVKDLIAEWTLTSYHEKANELANGVPYTRLKSNLYSCHDIEDYSSTVPVYFTLLLYGVAANNPTKQKDAIKKYILSNSKYGKETWVKCLPEIFTSTMFTFVPNWTLHGVANKTPETSLYSPFLPDTFQRDVISKFGKWDTSGDIAVSATSTGAFPTLHKSLNTVCIAGEDNSVEYPTILDIIPDYALVFTNSPDISYISKSTTEWLALFFQALIAAEEQYEYNSSTEVVKMTDDDNPDISYYVFEYKNVEFRVITRTTNWNVVEE